MKLKTFILIFLLLMAGSALQGQNNGGVGLNSNGAPADSSAMLDVSSASKGVLVPRLTNTQRDAISNPAQGLLIFNITTNCFNFFRNGDWYELCGNCIGPPSPALSSNSPLCEGDSLKLFASTVPGATGYQWTGPSGFTSSLQNPAIANSPVAASGTYQAVATGNNCNSQPSSLIVTVNPLPTAAFTASPAVASVGQNVTFSALENGAAYSWTFQNGNPATSSVQNPVVQWSSTGTFDVTLIVSKNGCVSADSSAYTITTYQPGSITFNYTGAVQNFSVPAGVTQLTIECWGAQGGTNPINVGGGTGGLGGYTTGQLTVTPGQMLYVYVGGQGATTVTGGWNGGGNGCLNPGGGGASDVRAGGQTLNDRVIVAGGGGGSSWETAWSSGWGVNNGAHNGGAGGGLTGQQGFSWQNVCQGGTGGTQSAGGVTGGSFGQGGNGVCNPGDTGGGGGGWYGGGGGGDCTGFNGSGGGGSSYLGGVTGSSTSQGIRSGNGMVVITY